MKADSPYSKRELVVVPRDRPGLVDPGLRLQVVPVVAAARGVLHNAVPGHGE